VAAKWDLDEDRLETLRSLKLLYDRDDTREFLHAYTAAFDDRFFFEIVQRIGDYQQYGAANATVRMAAQAQQHVSSRLTGLLD
jgi:4-hydroxyphenylpyruvate dioxygenase